MIFSAADDWLANTGINTTYSVMSAGMNTTSCEIWPTDGSEGSADPEQPEIGSQERRRRIIAEKSKKRHIVAVNGLLHRKQNLRITAPDTATKREGKLFFSFFTDRP
ncbi:hypothetical protein BEC95_23480 [Escherichia coli]|nr:hypothetical protein [Escherichia coli]MCH6772873.1 hypothetical protein [Escherichia coli]